MGKSIVYKAAVIGLGKIGLLYDLEPQRPHPSTHVVAYELSPDFELVCGIDGDKTKKTILQEMSHNAAFFSSLDDALNSGIMEDIDVVSICTPPSTHLDIIIKLIEAKIGKILFCEKPIVENLEEAEKLLKLVHESGITIVPNISRRWNTGLRKVRNLIDSNKLGEVQKIHIRYTRGIYNTGAHMFDLIKMWTGCPIQKVFTLGETDTSAIPEKTLSFYFEQLDGVTGYVEAINDEQYYLFDIDIYCKKGKIEMRNCGDEIRSYVIAPHHLYQGFNELHLDGINTDLLNDSCMGNAILNIETVLSGIDKPYCDLNDAIYPLKVADALEKSLVSGKYEEVF